MNARVLMAACLLICQAAAAQPNDQVWRDFVDWFKSDPITAEPPVVFRTYAQKLAAAGLDEATVKSHLATIQSMIQDRRREVLGIHFDKIYAQTNPPFKTDPNAYVVRMTGDLKPGRALDVGMGQGRNALHLAAKGWEVTGYDISKSGLAKAQETARQLGLKINTVCSGHEEFDFGLEQWDLIVMTYSLAPMSDRAFFERVKKSVKPGGVVVVEQFNAAPNVPTAIGPPNALIQTFEGMRVLHYEDTLGESDWGRLTARIGRITAMKDVPPKTPAAK